MKQTHAYATMEVTQRTHDEVRRYLEAAQYGHAILDGGATLDMHGIALVRSAYAPVDPKLALKVATEALDFAWAAIGDRLLAGGPLSKDYANSVMGDLRRASERVAAAGEEIA